MEWERVVGLIGEASIFVAVVVWCVLQLRELKRLRLEREARKRSEESEE